MTVVIKRPGMADANVTKDPAHTGNASHGLHACLGAVANFDILVHR